MKSSLFRHAFLPGLVLLALLVVSVPQARAADSLPQVPAPGRVTLVDLGAASCIPCKMMAPILQEVEKEYRGKAAVVFIDVRLHEDQVDRFRLKAIPTQVIYDASGREAFRHEGFLAKAQIVERLDALLKE